MCVQEEISAAPILETHANVGCKVHACVPSCTTCASSGLPPKALTSSDATYRKQLCRLASNQAGSACMRGTIQGHPRLAFCGRTACHPGMHAARMQHDRTGARPAGVTPLVAQLVVIQQVRAQDMLPRRACASVGSSGAAARPAVRSA